MNLLLQIFAIEHILLAIVFGFAFFILINIKDIKWKRSAPSLITTVGIACTFVGLSNALYRFDLSQDHLDQLNILLIGFKGAFIPSAIAIVFAVMFKVILIYKHENSPSEMLQSIQYNLQQLIEIQKILNIDIVAEIDKANNENSAITNTLQVTDLVIYSEVGFVLLSYELQHLKLPTLLLVGGVNKQTFILNYAKNNRILCLKNPDIYLQIIQNTKLGNTINNDLIHKLHEDNFDNKLFKKFLMAKLQTLVVTKSSFAIQGGSTLILFSFHADKVPSILYIAHGDEIILVRGILSKHKIFIINSSVVAEQLSSLSAVGQDIPELLAKEVGELAGLYYEKIMPFIK